VHVREPGLLTSVQAGSRVGRRRFGVTGAGPLDVLAHAAANEAVGNPSGAPALECTVAGPALEFLATVRFAISGADLGAVLERSDLGPWPVPLGKPVLARPGNVLRFAGRRSGCRAYVALAGGIDVPEVLGSRSTDLGAGFGGFGGRALRAGDELGLSSAVSAGAGRDSAAARYADSVTVRVVLGPQADHFASDTIERFLAETFAVGASSDRVGCRLEGEPLRHAGPAEILSDGMVPGSIQIPPDGRPIVMLGDAPTTGGYPKIATALAADLPQLAQLVPGQGRVRFEAVRLEDL
jgi:antagonist of KipI